MAYSIVLGGGARSQPEPRITQPRLPAYSGAVLPPDECAMQLPELVPDEQIYTFSYYWEGEIRSGMMLRGQLYALVDCFSAAQRLEAYDQGCRLSADVDAVLSVSSYGPGLYCLWVKLSTVKDPTLLKRSKPDCRPPVLSPAARSPVTFPKSTPIQ